LSVWKDIGTPESRSFSEEVRIDRCGSSTLFMEPDTCGVLTERSELKIISGECNHTLEFTAIACAARGGCSAASDEAVLDDELYKIYR